jgi:SMI1 / KNR4 family (SUKH-1)
MFDLSQPGDGGWSPEPPASSEAIQLAESQSKLLFPDTYRDFLKYSNGGTGDLSVEPGLIAFWKCEELSDNNRDYEMESHRWQCTPNWVMALPFNVHPTY